VVLDLLGLVGMADLELIILYLLEFFLQALLLV